MSTTFVTWSRGRSGSGATRNSGTPAAAPARCAWGAPWPHSRARACPLRRQARWHCLACLCQDRVLRAEGGGRVRLKGWLRSLPPQAHKTLVLRGPDGQPGRTDELAVAWAPVVIEAPRAGATPRLEWLLVSTLAVPDAAQALRLPDWYPCRWVIEEYHKCLKSGCAVEQRQLRTASGLEALLGFLAVVAVRLLQMRTPRLNSPRRRWCRR